MVNGARSAVNSAPPGSVTEVTSPAESYRVCCVDGWASCSGDGTPGQLRSVAKAGASRATISERPSMTTRSVSAARDGAPGGPGTVLAVTSGLPKPSWKTRATETPAVSGSVIGSAASSWARCAPAAAGA